MGVEQDRVALRQFMQALDIAPETQAAWVDKAAQGDLALRERVLALLRADAAMTLLGEGQVSPLPLPPSDIGVYRLELMIGAGGMGSVYRARRMDGLFDQVVAIRFMAPMQGHLNLGPLIDAERRSLARMNHEHIARILDGGQTECGLHYLVMEHVDGQPVSVSSGSQKLRVGLIRQIAAALAHAHQTQIVHCDIKPANILITPDGRAKLIDFGIARLQDMGPAGGLDGMTRAYASPERCRMAPATLADDVYALAVTLYEVLDGGLPWADPDRADAGVAPLRLVVPAGQGLHNPGDLGAILSKALSADKAVRYRSIEAFDADLARWQDRRPVSAIPPRPSYLAARLAQRRPVPVVLGVAALGLLIGALAVISNLYLSADKARAAADARFGELRTLARFMIFDLNDQLVQIPGATPARLALSGQAQFYLEALGATALQDTGLQREVATGLLRLAEVQGVPSRPNLGLTASAMANLERALRLFDHLLNDAPDDPVLRSDRGRSLYFLAITRGTHDQDPVAQLALAQRAEVDVLAAFDVAAGARRADLSTLLLGVRLTQADALATQGNAAAALAIRLSEEARIGALPAAERAFMDWDYQAGRVAALVGDSRYGSGDIGEAELAYQRASARFEAGLADDPLNRKLLNGLHYAYYSLSAVRADLSDPVGGLEQAQASADVAQRLLDWDPTDRLAQQLFDSSQGQIALMLRSNGRVEEAIGLIEAQVSRYRAAALLAPDDAASLRQVAVPLRGRAEIILSARGVQAGCAAYAEAQMAWAALEARFGLTALDRDGDVAAIASAMAANGCP